jgi:predicted  nucleic acid-binding Zn-ribbon protein
MNKKLISISFIVIILVACGIIFYLYNSLSTTQTEMEEMVEMMNYEKEQLENEYADVALEIEGMSIKVNNDSLLHQLDREQKRVQLLLEELRTVKATNARRIAELKEELSTVRKVLVTYVRQVDSLTAVNTKLEAENRQVQQRYEAATEEVKSLSEERERLVEKVTIASQLEATNVVVNLQNERGRKTKSVRKLAIIKVDYTIAKNNTAEVGNKTIYMRVATPDNMVLQKQPTDLFAFEGSQIAFSARKSFEYTGEEFSDAIYYTVTETLWEGDYRVDLFVDGHLIGQQYFNLVK